MSEVSMAKSEGVWVIELLKSARCKVWRPFRAELDKPTAEDDMAYCAKRYPEWRLRVWPYLRAPVQPANLREKGKGR
jgi:hypothetical protein